MGKCMASINCITEYALIYLNFKNPSSLFNLLLIHGIEFELGIIYSINVIIGCGTCDKVNILLCK